MLSTLDGVTNYKGQGEPKSRYDMAIEEYNLRLGGPEVRAENWRRAFGAAMLAAVVSIAGSIYLATQPRYVPFVIEVDKKSGRTSIVGELIRSNYRPQENAIKYFLSELITNVRGLPADNVVVKRNWQKAYPFLTQKTSNKIRAFMEKDPESPANRLGEHTVSTETIGVTQITPTSYHARWIEKVFGKRGELQAKYTMAGIFSIEIVEPTTAEKIHQNPLGIMVTDFEWHKELTK